MRFFRLLTAFLLLAVDALGVVVSNPVPTHEITLMKKGVTFNPGSSLPPPGTPCSNDCTCTEGNQPPEGRIYYGWCWGVDTQNGHDDAVAEMVRCHPGDCCNYGTYDGRCYSPGNSKPDYNLYCPNGRMPKY